MTVETRENRLKRLRIRCWRRGIKEMDLIFGEFADDPERGMATLDEAELDAFESLMVEEDNELYAWFSGRLPAPVEHQPMIARIMQQRN
ncbi:MAG: succinate dehydrogenase assembly factor 2 [Neomegalonema sp.]|nr:succinate dehydrogenase assembly factor 2 [Neomegalonema sp.]